MRRCAVLVVLLAACDPAINPTTMPTDPSAGDPTNQPPTANAGADISQDATLSWTTTLNAQGSFDPDGAIRFYRWEFVGTGNVFFGEIAEIEGIPPGVYNINLEVTDDRSAKSTDSLVLTRRGPLPGTYTGSPYSVGGGPGVADLSVYYLETGCYITRLYFRTNRHCNQIPYNEFLRFVCAGSRVIGDTTSCNDGDTSNNITFNAFDGGPAYDTCTSHTILDPPDCAPISIEFSGNLQP